MVLVHPFDDPDVIAGQGSVGLELLEQVPDLAKVVVPLGGGGLASGLAIAVKSARPEIEVVGVQAAAVAAFPASLELGSPVEVPPTTTIADGIALKRPGELTLGLVARWLDGVVTVAEDDIAEAMVLLMERAKLVVEGGGAVGVAALLTGAVDARGERRDLRDPQRRQRRRRAARVARAAAREPRSDAASSSSRESRTGPAGSRGCWRRSPRRAPTSSTSSTCARASTCTCARPACS